MSGSRLGIDIGGTASRWALTDETGALIARGSAAGATGHFFNPAERARLEATLSDIAAQVSASSSSLGAVVAGITGFGSVGEIEVKQTLTQRFGVAADRLTVIDDISLAYASVFEPGEGHLVSAGTGSIGLHVGAEAGYVRVGGRGILVDDGGSGSWIALRALDEIFRGLDRRGDFSEVQALADAVFSLIGGNDWHAVRGFVYGGDRGRIGTLATAVALAAHAGDPLALRILDQAGRELARLAAALVARTEARPTRFTGGVLKLHPVVFAAIAEELHGLDVAVTETDAALAASTLNSHWRETFAALYAEPGGRK